MIDQYSKFTPQYDAWKKRLKVLSREAGIVFWRIACITLIFAACGIDKEAVAPLLDADKFVGRVQFEFNTYNLAMTPSYDTVRLRSTVFSGTGEVIDEPVIYSVDNTAVLSISQDGLLKAVAVAGRTIVRATVTRNGVTRRDSALISIVAEVPTAIPARVTFGLDSSDSAKISAYRTKVLPLIRQDSAGGNLSSLLVALRSADTTTAGVSQRGDVLWVQAGLPGRTMLYVSTYAYGLRFRDSLSFVVGWPTRQRIVVFSRYKTGSKETTLDYAPARITVGVGACVLFYRDWSEIIDETGPTDTRPIDVQFDDPSAAGAATAENCDSSMIFDGGGNIAPFRVQWIDTQDPAYPQIPDWSTAFRGRVFSKPGVYSYHSAQYGTSGVITVCDDRHDQTCAENTKDTNQ